MDRNTASPPKKAEMTPLSKLLIDQIKSNDDMTKALQSGGFSLAMVCQARNRRAKSIRGHFQLLKGGLE